MRLIDRILTEQVEKDLLDELTHISITQSGIDELIRDYREEFADELDGAPVSVAEIQDYLGMKIVIEATTSWVDDKKYQLLKKA